ncbi:MAG TPA: lysophospholipid acyltransferase family protein [Rubricoccaceae bacterium]|jgi:1-acyl-sn-glycerol-3-phosphate acyltransferase
MDPATLDRLPRPGPLSILLGVLRVAGVLALLAVGTVVLLVAALLPVRPRGVRLAVHVAVGISRLFISLTGIRLVVEGRETLRAHRGFLFFNHLAWLDPIALMAVTPVRFLATQGVRRIPFVGWIAAAIGTLFVNRGRDESREAARGALRAAVAQSPLPVALAPEGGIGPGPGVLPLRHGAFEVAQDADADVLLVALAFDPPGYAVWEHETLVGPLWRLCARTGACTVRITALGAPVETRPPGGATAQALAAEATARFDAALVG